MVTANGYKFVSLNDAAADKNIKSIRATGAKLRKMMHETAVGLIMHMEEHGRHTKFQALADAIEATLGKNQRQAFVEWVLAFTWLTFDKEVKTFAKDKDKVNKIEDAKATPFWEFEREVAAKPVDIQKLIAEAFKRAGTALEKGNVTDAAHEGFLNHLMEAAKAYQAPKAEVIKPATTDTQEVATA